MLLEMLLAVFSLCTTALGSSAGPVSLSPQASNPKPNKPSTKTSRNFLNNIAGFLQNKDYLKI
jgi:hypothetical protein